MDKAAISDIEFDLLYSAIQSRYGYDFRQYSKPSFQRRISGFLTKTGHSRITDIIPKLLDDESFFASLLHQIAVTVTEMFRNPETFRTIRHKIAPELRKRPFFKVWHAGCSTGQEAYSMAILLKEEGLYDRCHIYATDFNNSALTSADKRAYNTNDILAYTENYHQSGGKNSFASYYRASGKHTVLNSDLKKNITFANHNLMTDSVFGQMDLILCRNVLIYFSKSLQNKVFRLFYDSLAPGGFLCLGSKESLAFTEVSNEFKTISKTEKIYRKEPVNILKLDVKKLLDDSKNQPLTHCP